ncbi:Zinc finger C-x8-C-x5-C-x3-H type (and similar) [Rhizoctonia solani]|uniref:Zinc finger C-x8-C-x5-C-x3-H type (And similar) n=1 Tax=Rhizoctonia solani TaxID=456999 RepID=A0A8H7IN26_9AGAM|nr:Zinc finger C-x8-C-x5-C-x3-H type (and similar) [Rhizoctonia solani]
MASQASDPLTQNPSLADVVHPDFHQVNSTVELYIKNQLGLKLDTDEQICRLALTPAGCPLGPRHCPTVLPGTRVVIDLPPSASIGCVDFVKREMDASFCMNTTYDVCQNVGGSLGMEHARLVTNAYTHIQRNEKLSALTTNEAFDRIVLENMSGVLRVILFLAPAKALSTQMKRHSPKPGIPPPEAYRPPSPPSQRDLGPPPPGGDVSPNMEWDQMDQVVALLLARITQDLFPGVIWTTYYVSSVGKKVTTPTHVGTRTYLEIVGTGKRHLPTVF